MRSMRFNKGQSILFAACAVWVSLIAVGLGLLWAYENRPGPTTTPPAHWPADSRIDLATDRATLLIMAHPHCPCTRASIGELARLMAQAQDRVTVYAIFLKPEVSDDDWEK